MSELEDQLDEDLGLLVKQLAHPTDIDRAALRVTASAVARKWLLDKNLAKLGKELGAVPKLPAIDTEKHAQIVGNDAGFQFYTAGGAALDGRPLNSFYDHRNPREDVETAMVPVPSEKNFTLSKFCSRRVSYYSGTWIKTEDIIRYVANKMGGVHYDTRRDNFVASHIERARQHFLLGNDESLQPQDHKGPFVRIPALPEGVWDFTQIEMLATAQSLCNVEFDGEPFMGFWNLDGPQDGNHRVLLGLRNHEMVKVEDIEANGWELPPVLKNRTKPKNS